MSTRTITLDDRTYDYLLAVSSRESKVLAALRAETAQLPLSRMQISPEQGQFLRLLTEMLGAKNALEVGTFTGYSAISVALALPPDGKLIACDVNKEWTDIAKRYFEQAGVAERVELRLAPALDTLNALQQQGRAGSFDLAFIDADKGNYAAYYEACLSLLRPGGVIAVDNALWGGDVADPENQDPDTVAIRALNERMGKDERVSVSLVPIGDGVYLARKR
ncbi:MAG TPA: class I SAM-dependent methyltransferase [Polyangiaceae bacterium]|nr:class I SAM-dependent methyltransferase [Polyangiaceae bacterium]